MAPPPPASKQVAVCYHYPCPDGVFAALAAWKHLHALPGISLRFQPHTVYNALDVEQCGFQGSHVYLLDFAGPPGFVRKVAGIASRVTLLDHHKTAVEAFPPEERESIHNLDCMLDMGRSGATIAYDWFEPQGLTQQQAQLFKYIEDADLWRWALEDSKAFHAGLGSLGLEYDANRNPSIFEQLLQLTPDGVIDKGREVLAEQERQIDRAVAGAFAVQLGGAPGEAQGWGRCLAVRADELSHLRSALGNRLAEVSAERGLRAVGVVAYEETAVEGPGGLLKISLRSVGQDQDTTLVTQAYGGGGHLNASSCMVPLQDFELWRC